jgi:exopolysaccharide production protein ExoQ
MNTKSREEKRISSASFLPLINSLIAAFTLFIVIWRILLWEILNPFIYAQINRILVLFKLPAIGSYANLTPVVLLMSQFVIIATVLTLGLGNKFVRRKEFWLMSIPLLGILIISICSQFWSVAVASTIKRSWFLLASVMGGIYIGFEFRRSRIIWIFESLSVAIVLLSFAMVVFYPSKGIMTFDAPGAWRGLFDYKSFAGEMIAFASIMFLFRLTNFKHERWFIRLYSFLFLMLSLYFLNKTHDSTAMGSFAITVGVFVLGLLFIKWGRSLKPVHWAILTVVGVFVLITMWFGKDALFGLLGRDATLNGRIPFWMALMPFIKQRLYFGYGFGEAFWSSPYLEEFWKIAPWKGGLAHSGYVEAILDTGLVGFFFWVLFLIEVGFLSLRYFFVERSLYSLIFFIWFIHVILNNVTENLLGTYESFNWLLLVISFAFLLRERMNQKTLPPNSELQT